MTQLHFNLLVDQGHDVCVNVETERIECTHNDGIGDIRQRLRGQEIKYRKEVCQIVDQRGQHQTEQLKLVHAKTVNVQLMDLDETGAQQSEAITEPATLHHQHAGPRRLSSQSAQLGEHGVHLLMQLAQILQHAGIDIIEIVSHIFRIVPQHKGIDGKLTAQTDCILRIRLRSGHCKDAAHLNDHHDVDQHKFEVHEALETSLGPARSMVAGDKSRLQFGPLQGTAMINVLEVKRVGQVGDNHRDILNERVREAHAQHQLHASVISGRKGLKMIAKITGYCHNQHQAEGVAVRHEQRLEWCSQRFLWQIVNDHLAIDVRIYVAISIKFVLVPFPETASFDGHVVAPAGSTLTDKQFAFCNSLSWLNAVAWSIGR